MSRSGDPSYVSHLSFHCCSSQLGMSGGSPATGGGGYVRLVGPEEMNMTHEVPAAANGQKAKRRLEEERKVRTIVNKAIDQGNSRIDLTYATCTTTTTTPCATLCSCTSCSFFYYEEELGGDRDEKKKMAPKFGKSPTRIFGTFPFGEFWFPGGYYWCTMEDYF